MDDRVKLLSIFPEELWVKILEKLHNSEHLTQVSNSTRYFRKFLLPHRTLFLFPKVWQILGMVYETSHDPIYQEQLDNQEFIEKRQRENDNFYARTMWFSGILRYRQVCKFWCSTVDSFYRNFEDIYRLKDDYSKLRAATKERYIRKGFQNGEWTQHYHYWETRHIEYFLEHFGDTHIDNSRSPFVANKLSVRVHNDGQDYLDNLCAILKKYGEHVWHCELRVRDESQTFPLYPKVVEVLWLMPNLRSLRFFYERRKKKGTKLEDLERQIAETSFPHFEQLKFINVDNLPGPVLNELLAENGHVGMLQMVGQELQNSYNIFYYDMSNLTQLSLEISSENDFEQLQTVEWKLEKIYLDFKCWIQWSEIFRVLNNKWGDTATNVAIHLPKATNLMEKTTHIYELANLRLNMLKANRLKIVLRNVSCIDFVLPMKDTLKHLDVEENVSWDYDTLGWKECGLREIVERTQDIDFFGFEDNFYYSNIWTVLPKLQTLGYKNDDGDEETYTRQKWNEEVEMRVRMEACHGYF